jgi:fatty acid photodecarboxylase
MKKVFYLSRAGAPQGKIARSVLLPLAGKPPRHGTSHGCGHCMEHASKRQPERNAWSVTHRPILPHPFPRSHPKKKFTGAVARAAGVPPTPSTTTRARRGPAPPAAAATTTSSPPPNAVTAGDGPYDFIIVGGGTAGCVLAARLTEDGSKKVLVVEVRVFFFFFFFSPLAPHTETKKRTALSCSHARSRPTFSPKKKKPQQSGPSGEFRTVRTPAGLPRLFKSRLDWNFYARPQPGADGRRVYMARGRLLGGSSATNATLYHRGAAGDYDGWGVDGWGSADVAPWFVASERNEIGPVPGVHGASGPLAVEFPRYRNRLHDAFFEAAASLGWPHRPDFNDWTAGSGASPPASTSSSASSSASSASSSSSQVGYGEFQVMQARGARCDAASAYLTPAVRARPNLRVVPDATVLKIEVEGGVARGVRFALGTEPDAPTTHAALLPGGEVLMAAGAVHTPHLLMLSGIGPARALRQMGLPVVADLPGVGAGLQDHPAALVSFTLKPSAGPIAITDELMHASGRIRAQAALNYLLRRRGPLASTGCDHGAFVSTGARSADLGPATPDLQIRLTPGLALNPDGIRSYVEFGRLKETGKKWPSGVTFQLLAVRPASRGSISLSSPDPWDAPLLNPGFLSDAAGADAATLRAGVRIARDLAATPAFESLIESEVHPGPGAANDAAIDEYVRATLHSGNAVVGSARMGPSPAAGAVVDADLRVHGVSGLRVCDASVFPVVPGGQTGAAVFMLAERAGAGLARGGGRVAGVRVGSVSA